MVTFAAYKTERSVGALRSSHPATVGSKLVKIRWPRELGGAHIVADESTIASPADVATMPGIALAPDAMLVTAFGIGVWQSAGGIAPCGSSVVSCWRTHLSASDGYVIHLLERHVFNLRELDPFGPYASVAGGSSNLKRLEGSRPWTVLRTAVDRGSLLATYRKPFACSSEGNGNGDWLGMRDDFRNWPSMRRESRAARSGDSPEGIQYRGPAGLSGVCRRVSHASSR